MRFSIPTAIAIVAAAVAACGGKQETPPANEPAAAPAATPGGAGAVVDVNMTGDGTTTARFEPDHLSITPGTTLRFHNVSGFPHNISFWADSIPAGAAPVLNSALHDAVGELQGELLTEAGKTYDVSFAGAPSGEYKGYCLPHLALGMRIWITVNP